MSILEVRDVSIRYITGDFKDIGLKEYVLRRLRHDYHVKEFRPATRKNKIFLEKCQQMRTNENLRVYAE